MIGASLYNRDKLYFCVIGDLAFFYDVNVLGNRHVGNNLRILLINNGTGVEFRQYNHYALKFGEEADKFIAASGHYGNKSRNLVRSLVESLGFKYLSAMNKDEFEEAHSAFVRPSNQGQSIVFEVFTEALNESIALEMMCNIAEKSVDTKLKDQ